MGFMRKSLFVATGGVSGVLGVKANSKKDRTAKATEQLARQERSERRSERLADEALAARWFAEHPGEDPRDEDSLEEEDNDDGSGSSINPLGVADELSKLAALRDSGVLTEDEFANQKARLLAVKG
jgi:hypothetical protein